MSMLRIALAALAIGSGSPPACAQQIGRLFHSAGERAALDSLRKAKSQQQKPVTAKSTSGAQVTQFDGYVVRSDGKSTLWVDGHAVSRTR
jgi:hypothetical protein